MNNYCLLQMLLLNMCGSACQTLLIYYQKFNGKARESAECQSIEFNNKQLYLLMEKLFRFTEKYFIPLTIIHINEKWKAIL
jgi:hypothetical protein